MKHNGQTWIFEAHPVILAGTAVGGKKEKEGPLRADFDYFFADDRAGCDTFEKGETALLQKACDLIFSKHEIADNKVDFFLAGDLMNQITSSSFVARKLAAPYLGVFAACASAMEGLALSALMIEAGAAELILTASVSNNKSAERQFRYPTEYGVQKPDSCHTTATAAGAVLVGKNDKGITVDSATVGKVIDLGVSDPLDMGSAMAPAAADTIKKHFSERNMDIDSYDYIITGDLGNIGQALLFDLLSKSGMIFNKCKFLDCGKLLYNTSQNVFSGGSGCGCIASVVYGHFLGKMQRGEIKKILAVGTGALLSPVSSKQGESIPAVAHAVALERRC